MKEKLNYTLHPWHGVTYGDQMPELIQAYIEISPVDPVKYEIDKKSGILKIDRPQKFSNRCPSLYGFIPQTYCGKTIAGLCMEKSGLRNIQGDGDPLDICVISTIPINHGNILLTARPIGGFRMIDKNEADDKIIAVLNGDDVLGEIHDVSECPSGIVEKLRHYFLTYKSIPEGAKENPVIIQEVYGSGMAKEVIEAAIKDYNEEIR